MRPPTTLQEAVASAEPAFTKPIEPGAKAIYSRDGSKVITVPKVSKQIKSDEDENHVDNDEEDDDYEDEEEEGSEYDDEFDDDGIMYVAGHNVDFEYDKKQQQNLKTSTTNSKDSSSPPITNPSASSSKKKKKKKKKSKNVGSASESNNDVEVHKDGNGITINNIDFSSPRSIVSAATAAAKVVTSGKASVGADADKSNNNGKSVSRPSGKPVPNGGALSSKKNSKNSKNEDRIWDTSSEEERQRIKEFWISLSEDERRDLVKIEKDTVLQIMKDQQRNVCSCSVCGRKRVAIEEELESLYDAYHAELEMYSEKGGPHSFGKPLPRGSSSFAHSHHSHVHSHAHAGHQHHSHSNPSHSHNHSHSHHHHNTSHANTSPNGYPRTIHEDDDYQSDDGYDDDEEYDDEEYDDEFDDEEDYATHVLKHHRHEIEAEIQAHGTTTSKPSHEMVHDALRKHIQDRSTKPISDRIQEVDSNEDDLDNHSHSLPPPGHQQHHSHSHTHTHAQPQAQAHTHSHSHSHSHPHLRSHSHTHSQSPPPPPPPPPLSSATLAENRDLYNFGNSLTIQGGILTVADDLLKNDGKKFIDMMEQLAGTRMAREEKTLASVTEHDDRRIKRHADDLIDEDEAISGEEDDEDYIDEYDDDEGDEIDDDDYDDEDDEDYDEDDDGVPISEEQRMAEGRRMLQMFAARMFEQRVLHAYREKVAQERQKKLLEELEEETRLQEEKELKKLKDKEKKKDKKRQQKLAKEEEKARKDAEKAQAEAALKAEQDKKAELARQRKLEQKKIQDEERRKKLEEERKREAEKERKRREREEKENQRRREKEAKEAEAKRLKEEEEAKIRRVIEEERARIKRAKEEEEEDLRISREVEAEKLRKAREFEETARKADIIAKQQHQKQLLESLKQHKQPPESTSQKSTTASGSGSNSPSSNSHTPIALPTLPHGMSQPSALSPNQLTPQSANISVYHQSPGPLHQQQQQLQQQPLQLQQPLTVNTPGYSSVLPDLQHHSPALLSGGGGWGHYMPPGGSAATTHHQPAMVAQSPLIGQGMGGSIPGLVPHGGPLSQLSLSGQQALPTNQGIQSSLGLMGILGYSGSPSISQANMSNGSSVGLPSSSSVSSLQQQQHRQPPIKRPVNEGHSNATTAQDYDLENPVDELNRIIGGRNLLGDDDDLPGNISGSISNGVPNGISNGISSTIQPPGGFVPGNSGSSSGAGGVANVGSVGSGRLFPGSLFETGKPSSTSQDWGSGFTRRASGLGSSMWSTTVPSSNGSLGTWGPLPLVSPTVIPQQQQQQDSGRVEHNIKRSAISAYQNLVGDGWAIGDGYVPAQILYHSALKLFGGSFTFNQSEFYNACGVYDDGRASSPSGDKFEPLLDNVGLVTHLKYNPGSNNGSRHTSFGGIGSNSGVGIVSPTSVSPGATMAQLDSSNGASNDNWPIRLAGVL